MAFQEVTASCYPTIIKLLESRLPKSAMVCNTVKIISSNAGKPPAPTSKVYRYVSKNLKPDNVDMETEFVVVIQYREAYHVNGVMLSSPENTTEDMKAAFENVLDWSIPITFCAMDKFFSKYVQELSLKHGELKLVDHLCEFMTVNVDSTPSQYDVSLLVNEIQQHFPDATLDVKELSPSDAVLVAKNWKYVRPGTEEYVNASIRHVGSAGVYLNDELISGVVIYLSGSIHALWTEERFRGKGIGMLTMKKVCQIALERGWMPNVQIALGNSASRRLMEKVGFTPTHEVQWVRYGPLAN